MFYRILKIKNGINSCWFLKKKQNRIENKTRISNLICVDCVHDRNKHTIKYIAATTISHKKIIIHVSITKKLYSALITLASAVYSHITPTKMTTFCRVWNIQIYILLEYIWLMEMLNKNVLSESQNRKFFDLKNWTAELKLFLLKNPNSNPNPSFLRFGWWIVLTTIFFIWTEP